MISHITYSVSNIKESMEFYNKLFDVKPVATGENLVYYDIEGLWLALNYEEVVRVDTYNHIAFYVEDIEDIKLRLDFAALAYMSGRVRNDEEGKSIYVRDLDGNLIEFHTKTLQDRLNYYKLNRKDIKVNL